MDKTVGVTAALLVVLGYVSVDAVGQIRNSLSPAATREIQALAESSDVGFQGPPRIVVALDANGRVAVLQPNGVEFETFNPSRTQAAYRFRPPAIHGWIRTNPQDAFWCPEQVSGGYDQCIRPRRP